MWTSNPELALLLAPLFMAACRGPDLAPEELDDLVHFFLAQAGVQDHEAIGQGADNLEAWFDSSVEVVGGQASGALTPLVQSEVQDFDELEWDPDPADADGVYVLTELDCAMDAAMEVMLEPAQAEMFPAVYEAYEREFDTDPDCFIPGSCDGVDWHCWVEDKFLTSTMTYECRAILRRSWHGDDGEQQAVLLRSMMPEPAVEDVEAGGMDQSYHIQAYIPRGEAKVLHLYAVWNNGWFANIGEDGDFWSNLYLDGLLEYDDRLLELCVADR